jgi:hypothetical protein
MHASSNRHQRRLWGADVSIRWAVQGDAPAIARLAELEDRPRPSGAVLIAQARGEVVAALPLEGGEPLADPFQPSTEIIELLAFRARQLSASSDRRRLWSRALGRILPGTQRAQLFI